MEQLADDTICMDLQIASNDAAEAYKAALTKQLEYALTKEEKYFQVYAHV